MYEQRNKVLYRRNPGSNRHARFYSKQRDQEGTKGCGEQIARGTKVRSKYENQLFDRKKKSQVEAKEEGFPILYLYSLRSVQMTKNIGARITKEEYKMLKDLGVDISKIIKQAVTKELQKKKKACPTCGKIV